MSSEEVVGVNRPTFAPDRDDHEFRTRAESCARCREPESQCMCGRCLCEGLYFFKELGRWICELDMTADQRGRIYIDPIGLWRLEETAS